MVAATRRQRARVAHNTGEQALLVLRKTGWMSTPADARSAAKRARRRSSGYVRQVAVQPAAEPAASRGLHERYGRQQ